MDTEPDLDLLLPHRPPMRLVDRVLSVSGADISVEGRYSDAKLFPSALVSTAWCLELMSQAAGIWFNLQPGDHSSRGRLIQARNLEFIQDGFPRGALLRADVKSVSSSSQGFHLFKGEVRMVEPEEAVLLRGTFAILRMDAPDDTSASS